MSRKVILESQFKRDIKTLFLELTTPAWAEVLHCLCNNIPLAKKYEDHELKGKDWKNCRECHVKPDMLLVYIKKDEHYLQLVRLGTHSELFKQ